MVVKQSCPGSVETMNILTTALETVRMELKECGPFSLEEVRQAKIFLRQALDAL